MIEQRIKINDQFKLIEPDTERDVPLSVQWRSGIIGHETQASMGIPASDIHDPTIEEEKNLIKQFIETDDEILWMIEYRNTVVGAIEVGTKIAPEEEGPSISIMVGDTRFRGKGIASAALKAAMSHLLKKDRYKAIHARYLTKNVASKNMCHKLGFTKDGEPYTDEDNLTWQNVKFEK